MVAVLLVAVSDAVSLSTRGRATSTVHGMASTAAGILRRLQHKGFRAKVLSNPSKWPPITKADMYSGYKWHDAIHSKDLTLLSRMLRRCRGRGAQYEAQICTAYWRACSSKRWDSYTKIIEAMSMDLNQFRLRIFVHINDALKGKDVPLLVATLEGIAGNNKMIEHTGMILATLVMNGLGGYPVNMEKICESVTHAGLREFSAIVMIENKHERLAASIACLQRRNDWPRGLIERMAKIIYETRDYCTLELLLHMGPSNKSQLRRWAISDLGVNILQGNLDRVNWHIRIFNISTDEVHGFLKDAVMDCINSGLPERLENIIMFLDDAVKAHTALGHTVGRIQFGSVRMSEYLSQFLISKPQQYKLAVEEALGELTQKDATRFDITESQKRCHQMIKDWITKEEVRQKEEDGRCTFEYPPPNEMTQIDALPDGRSL